MSFKRWLWGGAAITASMIGCALQKESSGTYPPPPPCMGMFCGSPAGGAVSATGSGGAGGSGVTTGAGAGMAIDVTGQVNLIVSPDFADTGALYLGYASIQGRAPGGQLITAMYGNPNGNGGAGGAANASFTLDGVASGEAWLEVVDETNGGAGILSTYSVADLSAQSPLTLPVIDLDNLENIASSLPSVVTVGTGASQLILRVENSLGAAYAGVSVSTNPVGGTVVYDTGDGVYDDMETMTGGGGTIIIFNAAINGAQTLQLTYMSQSTMATENASVPIQGAPGAATLLTVQLPN